MCAAGIDFASRPAERWLREHVSWRIVCLALLTAVACGVTVLIKYWFRFMPYSDALVGAATASALLYLTPHALRPAEQRRPLLLRILESGPLVALGRFSYSLYLTHFADRGPVLLRFAPARAVAKRRNAELDRARLAPVVAVFVRLFLGFSSAVSWVPHLPFFAYRAAEASAGGGARIPPASRPPGAPTMLRPRPCSKRSAKAFVKLKTASPVSPS